MLLEIGLALGLTITTATAEFRPLPEYPRFDPRPAFLQRLEAETKPEGPKWAPNRMKILQFNRRGRWVVRLPPALLPRQSSLDRARNKLGQVPRPCSE